VQFTSSCVLDLGLKIQFSRTGPWCSQIGPWDEKSNGNVVPGTMAGGPSSIPVRGGSVRPGKCGGGTKVHLGFDSRVRWGGGATGDDVWRRHGSQASCASVPATWSTEEASSRLRKVQGLLVEAVVRLEGDGVARDGELAESMAMVASSSSTPVRQARKGETAGSTAPSIGGMGLLPTPWQRRAPAWAAREDGQC
jgi:hypothetical protein